MFRCDPLQRAIRLGAMSLMTNIIVQRQTRLRLRWLFERIYDAYSRKDRNIDNKIYPRTNNEASRARVPPFCSFYVVEAPKQGTDYCSFE